MRATEKHLAKRGFLYRHVLPLLFLGHHIMNTSVINVTKRDGRLEPID